MLGMPGHTHKGPLLPLSPEEAAMVGRLEQDIKVLAGDIGERNTRNHQKLDQAARYIAERFRELGYAVREEPYSADGHLVKNIEARLQGSGNMSEMVVVGAHYDSVPGSPGANDNASGVAAMLELARGLKDSRPSRSLRFVAFVNEEPPFFQTDLMGSRIYARGATGRGDKIVAMLSLETMGYYSDEPGSQKYPPPFSLFYPDTGNFIGFVSNLASRSLLRNCIGIFRETTQFPSEGLAAPELIPGIDWSDQWSFWKEGFPALMITDTAPYRYPYYHEPTDTPDKLDYQRLARVVSGVGRIVEKIVAGKLILALVEEHA